MIPFFYVHRYSNWHITLGGDWNTTALCGEKPQAATGYWNTRRRFKDERDPRLEVDERGVCGGCLLQLPLVASGLV